MYYFIHNPVAGNGYSIRVMKSLEEHMQVNAISYIVEHTQYPGHATKIAQEAYQKGYRRIISVGGDGTIIETANGIIGTDATLGIIPGGTGNDFIRALKIPSSPIEALQVIKNNYLRKVDVGIINDRYFLNIAGTGFDAEVVSQTAKLKRLFIGKLSYLLSVFIVLIRFTLKEICIEIDGTEMKRKILLIAIANGNYFGGGMMVAPHAQVDDGYLDVCIASNLPKWKVPLLLPKFISGKHLAEPCIEYIKAKTITVTSIHPLPLNVDGELYGTTPFTCHLSPYKLNIIAPAPI